MTKQERVEAVNKMIKLISESGRQFFKTKSTGDIASMAIINGRVYYIDNYTKKQVYCKNGSPTWDHFSSGGTLQALVLDFADFIRTGKDTNGKNGYGRLFCGHWGYSDGAKSKVIDYAKTIGFVSR